MPGNLFAVVAPSGAGKTSLVNELLRRDPRLRLSISYTTRAPRDGEVHGREYHFVDRAEFERMIASGDFLEHAKDAPESIATRMASARNEVSHVLEFEYIIVNEEFDSAVSDLQAIVRASRAARDRQSLRLASLLAEFK
jgi:guanylate kinase